MSEDLKKSIKKDLFSIPNILCYIRLLLIPVFMYTFLSPANYAFWVPALILIVISFTDFLDGFIARRFNMITEWGKLIDPLADKLTQAAVVFCLATSYPLMWWLLGVLFFKETYMLLKGVKHLKDGKEIFGAQWFGKLSTLVLFGSLITLVLFPNIPTLVVNIIIVINISIVSFSHIMYYRIFRNYKDGSKDNQEN